MPDLRSHTISLDTDRRPNSTWWCSHCSCGKYKSRLHGSPGRAEIAGDAHARAKTGAAQ